MNKLLATAFWTSVISYGFFALADILRVGFVSYYFSVHWFLFISIILAVLWTYKYRYTQKNKKIDQLLIVLFKILLSITLLVIVWSVGSSFQDLRPFMALVAGSLPWVVKFKQIH